ncbi:hypothetical protein Pla52n_56670 [Stieleria varia]|uniref:Uncharacterized protein n=1 Tax=Stieleria varia TaxID=2528005 RepID=A0A5C6A2S0_9BACT|nr:hypothetical protein Pla52n_56670 [Stieleria varia]
MFFGLDDREPADFAEGIPPGESHMVAESSDSTKWAFCFAAKTLTNGLRNEMCGRNVWTMEGSAGSIVILCEYD